MTAEQAKENTKKYPPGSDAARAIHCTCAVFDNRRGKGAYVVQHEDGTLEPHFWISGNCPVHGAMIEGEQ